MEVVEPLYFFKECVMITKICVNCDDEKPITSFMKQSSQSVLLDKCWSCNLIIIRQGMFWSEKHADNSFRL